MTEVEILSNRSSYGARSLQHVDDLFTNKKLGPFRFPRLRKFLRLHLSSAFLSIKLPNYVLNWSPANWTGISPLLQDLRTGPATAAVPCVTVNNSSILWFFHADDAFVIMVCVLRNSNDIAFLSCKWWNVIVLSGRRQTVSDLPRVFFWPTTDARTLHCKLERNISIVLNKLWNLLLIKVKHHLVRNE